MKNIYSSVRRETTNLCDYFRLLFFCLIILVETFHQKLNSIGFQLNCGISREEVLFASFQHNCKISEKCARTSKNSDPSGIWQNDRELVRKQSSEISLAPKVVKNPFFARKKKQYEIVQYKIVLREISYQKFLRSFLISLTEVELRSAERGPIQSHSLNTYYETWYNEDERRSRVNLAGDTRVHQNSSYTLPPPSRDLRYLCKMFYAPI